MIALYSFGQNVESGLDYSSDNGIIRDNGFEQIFGSSQGKLMYAIMYVAAIGFSLLPTYARHKDDYHYRSLGASGAVSAVIFAGMLLEPRIGVGILFIPISIPGYVFAPLFLVISHYLARKGHGNINHSAHLWGALFGMAFLLANAYALTDYDIITQFVQSVRSHINI
jgi:membrane associated rhomboid family serine protease